MCIRDRCLRAPALRRRHCRAKKEPDRGSLGRVRPIPPTRRPGEPTLCVEPVFTGVYPPCS
eukprot:8492470-Alexandrium_andersonii.AAC.1